MGNREWANVCFRYYPPNFSGDLNELNGKIRAGLLQTGRFMVSRSLVGESVVIRAVIANPGVSKESLQQFVAEVIALGRHLVLGAGVQNPDSQI